MSGTKPSPSTRPTSYPSPFILGVAGAIGSGKSAASGCFAELGCLVVNFDREARAALDLPAVRRRLIEWWGIDIVAPTGLIDRDAIARVVFSDERARRRLERLIHPIVWRTREQAREEARRAGVPGIILDAPLLYEVGLDASCDEVVFIDAPEETRTERVRGRGWSVEELRRRESAQMPAEEKRRRAGFRIENNGSIEDLRGQVRGVFAILCGHAEPNAER